VGAGVGLAILAALLLTPYFKGNLLVNPVPVRIGGFPVYWYGLTMAGAVLAAFYWFRRRAALFLGENHVINLAIWLVGSGIVGARLTFVILKWPDFSTQPWWTVLDLHSGGLSIHGALLFGVAAAWLYARRYRLPTLQLFDLLAPPVVVGQIIGRLGNFFNQEAFGGPTTLPWKMFVAPSFRPAQFSDQQFFHPTFLYSMVGLAIVLAILMAVEQKVKRPGAVLLAYIIAYAVERFIIEWFRVDSTKLGALTWAQWASIGAIMIALAISLIWKGRTIKKT
jgi:phosphatidylglycerol:prolipoprotein diacylglycerol transferase